MRAVFGGEAMSEPARRYLLRSFKDVLGSYGASDLEINMAAESPFTIALRQEMERNPALQERLTVTKHGVLPMVFQYNPLVYCFQTNQKGELITTLSRPTNVAPKIRYNIHDLGHAARYEDIAPVLVELGLVIAPRGAQAAAPPPAVHLRPVGHVDRLLRRQRHA